MNIVQRSLAGGEITPPLYARVDVAKYQTAVRQLRNFMVMRHGGAANRPGSEFVGEVSDSSSSVRLIPFVFSAEQTYVLEFGEGYMRVIQDGAHLTDTAETIEAVTKADPAVVTITGHSLSTGDEIYVSGVTKMPELNNRNFKVTKLSADTFSLQTMDGNDLDSSGYAAAADDGTTYRIYEIGTPYAASDLATLNYVQSADVVTLVHPSYAPRELARTGHTSWALSKITFSPSISAPSGTPSAANNGGSDPIAYNWIITSIDPETGEESLGSTSTNTTTTNFETHPVTVSWNAVTGVDNYYVYRAERGNLVYGYVGLAGTNQYVDTGLPADFDTTPPKSRNPFDASEITITGVTQASPAVVSAAGHAFSDGDEIYINDIVGMTELNNRTFIVANKAAGTFELTDSDGNDIDSSGYTAYSSAGEAYLTNCYPSTVTYYQQRLVLGNTGNEPEKVWTSRSGMFHNLTVSTPVQDDDAVTFTLAGRQVNSIRHLTDLGTLVAFTAAGELSIDGDDAGILKPTAINPRQQSYNGASTLAPINIGKSALYLQARGSIVRDLGFDVAKDGFNGGDLTIFSAHLFDGYSMVDWAYQQVPHSVLWVVRGDGKLLGLTYVKEHEMVAWHRHDFEGGLVKNVCVVPEGSEDVLYVLVSRTINGTTKQYIERMSTRAVDEDAVEDCTFLDSFLTYDGRNTGATTMALTSVDGQTITSITQANPGVVTIAGHGLSSGDDVYISDVGGMVEINDACYTVVYINENTFSLTDASGVAVNTSAYTEYTTGGVAGTWLYTDTLTLTASLSTFVSTDVGNQIHLTGSDGDVVRFTITGYTSDTVVTGKPHKTVPSSLQATAVTTWSRAVDEVSGLWHLEGEDVSVFADGFVVANPNNAAYTTVTVSSGTISLDKCYAVIHVGLPYTSDIETLDIDTPDGETIADKKKLVNKLTIFTEKSRGIWAGTEPPSDDDTDPLEGLTEVKIRNDESYDGPVALRTGTMDVTVQGSWNRNGRVFIRQVDPIPLSVLAIVPSGMFPFRG